MIVKYFILIVCFCLGSGLYSTVVFGQTKDLGETMSEDKTYWEKNLKNVSYLKKEKKKDEEIDPEIEPSGISTFWGTIILFGLGLFVVGLIAYFFLSTSKLDPKSKKITHDISILDEESISESTMQTDLSAVLDIAKQQQDLKKVVRALFITELQNLHSEKIINWSVEKTNRNLLEELKIPVLKPSFSNIVKIYEKIWFDDSFNHHKLEIEDVTVQFDDFSKQVNHLKTQLS